MRRAVSLARTCEVELRSRVDAGASVRKKVLFTSFSERALTDGSKRIVFSLKNFFNFNTSTFLLKVANLIYHFYLK